MSAKDDREAYQSFSTLLAEGELFYRQSLKHHPNRGYLDSFVELLAEERLKLKSANLNTLGFAEPETAPPPGAKHLEAALAAAESDAKAPAGLTQSIRAISRKLPWSSFYQRDLWSREFVDEIAAILLIGPKAVLSSRSMKLGAFVMGADVHYPLHAHAAEELYLVVGGDISFRSSPESPWQWKKAGELVHHESNQPHEMLTGDRGALLFYIWRAEIFEPSWYKGEMNTPEEPPKYPEM